MSSFQVLVDSDAFVAWAMPDDLFHTDVQAILARLGAKQTGLISTSWVIAETATVLSHRSGQATARQFLDQIDSLAVPVIHMTAELQAAATDLFKAQETRGTSMVDCGNVAVMRQFDIPEILSFDKFYRHQKVQVVR